MKTDEHPRVYSIKETCERTKLGKTRVYQLVRAGNLRIVKVGRRTLVQAESIEALLESGC